jgi:N-methylhydantoinase B
LGYHKRIRALQDMELLSNADRSMLNTYGLDGGSAGGCYGVAVERHDGDREELAGMADDVPVREGDIVEIVTTGGGGWGDPLEREPERVRVDVIRGVVSDRSARQDYGVVLGSDPDRTVDAGSTTALRSELADARPALGMFDRGPHFERLRAAGDVARPTGWDDPDLVP